jgi:hypothetical protein
MKGKKGSDIRSDVASDSKKGGKGPTETKSSKGDAKTSPGGDNKIEGVFMKKRLDRPGRKTGGRVGADSAPLSQAAKNTGGRSC